MEADKDGDGKLSFEEFTNVVAKTVRFYFYSVPLFCLHESCAHQDIAKQMTLEDLF